jgi:hypothetical protein
VSASTATGCSFRVLLTEHVNAHGVDEKCEGHTKLEGQISFGRPRRRREDNMITMDFTETVVRVQRGFMWFRVWVQCRAVVNMVMNIPVA